MNPHCMHEFKKSVYSDIQRACCWCSLIQSRVQEGEPVHGPNFRGDRYRTHWEPPSTNQNCPRDAEDIQSVVAAGDGGGWRG